MAPSWVAERLGIQLASRRVFLLRGLAAEQQGSVRRHRGRWPSEGSAFDLVVELVGLPIICINPVYARQARAAAVGVLVLHQFKQPFGGHELVESVQCRLNSEYGGERWIPSIPAAGHRLLKTFLSGDS